MKQRKPQSHDEYTLQKNMFYAEGPMIDDVKNIDIPTLDLTKKVDRNRLVYFVNKLYFDREYKQCMDVINTVLIKELDEIKGLCQGKIDS